MPTKCTVCWKPLRSEKSRALWMWPSCAKKVAEKFWKGRRLPAPNQSSIFSKKEIVAHYSNNLLSIEKSFEWSDMSDFQKEADKIIKIREIFEWNKKKKTFIDFLETQFILWNTSVEIILKYKK
jgi:hypothetical protein